MPKYKTNWTRVTKTSTQKLNVQFIAGLKFNCVMKHDQLFSFLVSELMRANGCVISYVRLLVCIFVGHTAFVRPLICHHDFQLQIQIAYNAHIFSLSLFFHSFWFNRSTFSIVLHIDITSFCIWGKKETLFYDEKKIVI